MPLIVGLGNPGTDYEDTPHNVGFEVAARLARRNGVTFRRSPAGKAEEAIWSGQSQIVLLRPLSYMNLSGGVVGAALRWHRWEPANLLVVCDDVNLPIGYLRFRTKGGSGGQKGLLSIIEVLGTEEFPRLRIGVGGGEAGADVAQHVLKRFSRDVLDAIDKTLDLAADAVECFIRDGFDTAMNRYNTRRSSADNNTPSGDDGSPDDFSP
jgi:peptidyl-tRNA hydrolase, PTH1 family